MFRSMLNLDIAHVPYKGSGPALTDLIGGQVTMMFDNIPSAISQIRAGKLRALATTGPVRSPTLPELPTMIEAGFPGYISTAWFGIVAPPKTPAALAEQISRAVAEALKLADVSKQLVDMSMEAVGGTPAEMAQYLREESRRWGAVIRQSGARAD
jgi:tripartite-type tricarboxylate transporter receptor subunit TctC